MVPHGQRSIIDAGDLEALRNEKLRWNTHPLVVAKHCEAALGCRTCYVGGWENFGQAFRRGRNVDAHRPIWQIEYLTTRNEDRVDLLLILDAVTGEELCAEEIINSKINLLTNNYHR